MHHLNTRNIVFALQFTTILLPRPSGADEFTTTECHCFGVYDKIPDNHGILSLSYYHDASKTTGHIDVPCPKGGCKPRKKSELAFCGTPQKEHGAGPNEPAFDGEEGLCYKSTRDGGKKTVEQILFPTGDGAAGQLLMKRGDEIEIEIEGDDHLDDDMEITTGDQDQDTFQDEEGYEGADEQEEFESTSDPLPNETPSITTISTGNSSAPLPPPNDTSTNTTTPAWQTLTHKTTRRLNSKSVCVDICWRYYSKPTMPDCGTWVLPGIGGPRGPGQKRSIWKNNCKKTAWRKVVNANLGVDVGDGEGDVSANVTAAMKNEHEE